jgi:release factor glutamine methyltransferase
MTGTAGESSSGSGPAVRDLLLEVASRLGSATEARWLVEQALGEQESVFARARSGTTATAGEIAAVEKMVERRLAGEPLQYVLGNWAFRTLDLAVDPRVLIPRPETEVVVGHALDELVRFVEESETRDTVFVADLGTGSGAMALSIAVEGPAKLPGRTIQVYAVDSDESSLSLAASNVADVRAANPGSASVELVHGSWFEPLPASLRGRLALVVTNPPYVSEHEWEELDPVVRDHEPRGALVAGPRGTEAIDEIMNEAPSWLAPAGAIVVEVAPHQADDAALRAIVSGFDAVVVRKDFAERSRALVARYYGHDRDEP